MKPGVLAAAVLLPGFAAFAQTPGIQGVVDALRARGYTDIEVSRPHGGKITVEAYRQGAERELVYDAQTGRLLTDESNAAGADRVGTVHDTSDDHGSGSSSDHDASDDHSSGGRGSSSSHDSGDDRGSGSGSHEPGDDHDSGDE